MILDSFDAYNEEWKAMANRFLLDLSHIWQLARTGLAYLLYITTLP